MVLDNYYHKSLKALHINCEEPRAYFIPYSSEKVAKRDNRQESENFLSLCGDWDFHFYNSIHEAPNFLDSDFVTDGDKMTVPRSWQTMVVGLGFERMLMYITGVQNIRDVLMYPRTVGSM